MENRERETFTVLSSIYLHGYSHLNVTEQSHSVPAHHIQEVRVKGGGSGQQNPAAWRIATTRGVWLKQPWRGLLQLLALGFVACLAEPLPNLLIPDFSGKRHPLSNKPMVTTSRCRPQVAVVQREEPKSLVMIQQWTGTAVGLVPSLLSSQ